MAAPTPTTRQTPTGIRLTDGFSTKFCPKSNPTISFWESTVTPPGIDGGDEIDTTTMHNTTWRTRDSRALRTLTEAQCKAAYDPVIYTDILTLVNLNDEWTVRFPDGSTLAFWGFLKTFEPDEVQEGEMPMATVTICPTNMDNSGAEQAPVLASVTGT
jgi:hypothetical protein